MGDGGQSKRAVENERKRQLTSSSTADISVEQ